MLGRELPVVVCSSSVMSAAGFIFEARRLFPELKGVPGIWKLYDLRERDLRVETHCTKGLMPLSVAQKIAVASSALLHTATLTLSSGARRRVVSRLLERRRFGKVCLLTCYV